MELLGHCDLFSQVSSTTQKIIHMVTRVCLPDSGNYDLLIKLKNVSHHSKT